MVLFRNVVQFFCTLPAFVRWSIVVVWYGLIFTVSHIPGGSADATHQYLEFFSLEFLNAIARKIAHVAVFGVMSVTLYNALHGGFTFHKPSYIVAVVLNGILGFSDELHQYYTPNRHFKWSDVVLDTSAGIFILGLVLYLWHRTDTYSPHS